ncbi:hypothetical protein HK100_012243 [Physocladia obscura]|uniref:CRAL-TRIO domain-containing protein n=1 Tax=Physocladia obscura TaxID=109957 RepID=A0AAD5T013_9FUNG|nr:hypothetical protein HK100_012243 [Physocladia obscura]
MSNLMLDGGVGEFGIGLGGNNGNNGISINNSNNNNIINNNNNNNGINNSNMNSSMMMDSGANNAPADSARVYQLILDLTGPINASTSGGAKDMPDKRELALIELSKKREAYEDLAPILWHTFGVMSCLVQEMMAVYPLLAGGAGAAGSGGGGGSAAGGVGTVSPSPPLLSNHASNRVCNALALLQCVASHPDTRALFLAADIPLFLYPFLNSTAKTRAFEYLRLTSLGVIGALVKNDSPDVINFLLSTEIIPLCLRIMESGSELSKTVAIFIVQKILLDEMGLNYICQTYERFNAVGTVLANMVSQLVEQQSVRLLKHVVRCYLRLSDNPRAKEALRQCLPEPLRDNTFAIVLKDDVTTKRCLLNLIANLDEQKNSISSVMFKKKERDTQSETFSINGDKKLGLPRFRTHSAQPTIATATTSVGDTLTEISLTATNEDAKTAPTLNVPLSHGHLQRPASDGSSKMPSSDELVAFVAFAKDRLKNHEYLSSMLDADIKRFLVAHRNNQANALKQLQATLDWRASINFNSILSEDFSDLEATHKLTIDSTDKQQNAVMIWQQYRHTPLPTSLQQTQQATPPNQASNSSFLSAPTPQSASSSRTPSIASRAESTKTVSKSSEKDALAAAVSLTMARNLRFFVYTIERAKKTHRLRADNRLTVIIDRSGMTPVNYDQPLGKAIITVMPHYPDLFDAYYVFPRNAVLNLAWKVTRVFLDPVTVARIRLLTDAEVPKVLGEIIDKSELLVRYGGNKVVKDEDGGGNIIFGTETGGDDGTSGIESLGFEDADDSDNDDFADAEGHLEESILHPASPIFATVDQKMSPLAMTVDSGCSPTSF